MCGEKFLLLQSLWFWEEPHFRLSVQDTIVSWYRKKQLSYWDNEILHSYNYTEGSLGWKIRTFFQDLKMFSFINFKSKFQDILIAENLSGVVFFMELGKRNGQFIMN